MKKANTREGGTKGDESQVNIVSPNSRTAGRPKWKESILFIPPGAFVM
jgi:hypothetical protein